MDFIDKQNENVSIFQTLKYSGERFFENKKRLRDIRIDCDKACEDNHEKFKKISDSCKPSAKRLVDEILFKKLSIKKPNDINCEKRRECSSEEAKLILDSCQNTTNPENYAEHIKYSLGFLAKGYISTFKKPCVAVVGQTKAGKSSLINCILQARVVPQKVSRQTARVTYVTHCPIKFVAHMKDSILKKIEVNVDIKSEDVDLQFEERNKKEEVNVEIRIGTTNPIIQNGFDIVDSPGLNENPSLNELCAKMERSLLPLLIYVVEGRNGLTQTDIDDIFQIRSRSPQLKIIYFVTKLDRSKFDRIMYLEMKEKKGFSKDEDMPGESDIEVANRRLNKVLIKLKNNGFLPLSAEIKKSRDFHGADICSVNETRIHNPTATITESSKYQMELMTHFEEKLMIYLKDMLESPLKEEVNSILSAIENSLEKATSVASEIASEKYEKQKYLDLFQLSERNLFENEKDYIESTLKSEINKMIGMSKAKIIDNLNSTVFPGENKSQQKTSMSTPNSEELKNEIKKTIEKSLNEEIKYFISKFMVDKEERLRKKLRQIVEKLSAGKYGYSSFKIMLRNRLLHEYEFYEEFIMLNENEYSFNSISNKKIGTTVESFGQFNCFSYLNSSSADSDEMNDLTSNVQPKNGKQAIANAIINSFDRDKFLKSICDAVTKEFISRHNRFQKELTSQGQFLEDDLVVGTEEKKCVRMFAEHLAVQYALTLHVRTPLYVMVDPLKPIVKIVKGGQGQVEKVFTIGSTEPIVRKQYAQTFRNFTNSERLLRISMEIYYSSRLDHPRCLKLLGIYFEDSGEGWRFSAYYPYLEMGSLKKFLKAKKFSQKVDVTERVKLSVEIAQGIQFLHTLQIVHRDINPNNVLVRKDPQNPGLVEAVISDYGLTKSFGFIENTDRIGTPLYMAPEFFRNKVLIREGYTHAVDVFSFGMLLWQLMGYRLTEKYKNYYPQFAIDCEHNKEKIEKRVLEGVRPEERSEIPIEIYDLIQRCWQDHADKRPSFYKRLKDVDIDCDTNDPMKDKTILDVLTEFQNHINQTNSA